MKKLIRAADRHFSDHGWLQTYWLFSFETYHDPDNLQHGVLRVFNDDVVHGESGFDTHPHREMEIVTLVFEGEITHADSLGNRTVIGSDEVQRMTAGTGVTHSEHNRSTKPVHFYQIWFLPSARGLPPEYEQKRFSRDDFRNRLLPLASGEGKGGVLLNARASLFRGEFEKGRRVEYSPEPHRKLFLYVGSGEIEIDGRSLSAGDQLRWDSDGPVSLNVLQSASLVWIDAAPR